MSFKLPNFKLHGFKRSSFKLTTFKRSSFKLPTFKWSNFKLTTFKRSNFKLTTFKWSSFQLFLSALVALSAVSGCATTEHSAAHVVHLTKSATVSLPQLQLPEPISSEQLLTITYQGKQDKALVILEGQDAHLKLSVLSPLGIRLVDASYDQGQLQVTKHLPLDQLPPAQQVLFDIFLGLLPAADITAVLPSGFSLTDNGAVRTITDKQGQVIEQVHFTPTKGNQSRSATKIEHRVFGYVIEIENL